jgi:uncharacterized membrane protein YkoI
MKTVALALFVAVPALAGNAAKQAQRLSQAKITLGEAIAAAEAKANGKAVNADLDSHRGKVVFEVEVLSNARLFDVMIDAADGKVLELKEDKDR